VFIIFVLIIFSSTLFYFEHEVQTNRFSNIPEAIWWGVNAKKIVGDTDYRPITPIGKIIGV
jgi:voltage-gated potassium channel